MMYKYVALVLLINITWFAAQCQTPAGVDTSNKITMEKITAFGPAYNLLKPMEGDWDVQQKIWTIAGAKPTTLFHIAHRKMIGHFLQEIMEPRPGTNAEPFNRITYLQVNNADLQWEYIVLDTRYPVMMMETRPDTTIQNDNKLTLYLPSFVMPPGWDNRLSGQLAKERRLITFESPDKMVMQQYWTLPTGKEFLAMEYSYIRRRNPG